MVEPNQFQNVLQEYLPPDNRITQKTFPEEKSITYKDIDIFCDEYIPQSTSSISIVLFHGVGGNRKLLSFIAVPLVTAGYHVVFPDLPGYGDTRISRTFDYQTWIDQGEFMVHSEVEAEKQVTCLASALAVGWLTTQSVECNMLVGL